MKSFCSAKISQLPDVGADVTPLRFTGIDVHSFLSAWYTVAGEFRSAR